MSEKARVVVVDDHPLFRERLCQLINNEPIWKSAVRRTALKKAIQIIRETSPDLGYDRHHSKDVERPRTDQEHQSAFDRCSRFWSFPCTTNRSMPSAPLRAGASGYITKSQEATQVLFAVRSVLGGKNLSLGRK